MGVRECEKFSMIYIISRGRPGNVVKLKKRWAAIDFDDNEIVLVVDSDDSWIAEYERLAGPGNLVFNRYRGVGGARATAVEHAAENGFRSIIMSDDDIAPAGPNTGSANGYRELLDIAQHPNALGVGAYVDYHSFALRGHLDRLCIPGKKDGYSGYDRVLAVGNEGFICPTGIAFRMFGINIANAVKLCGGSGFDSALWCQNEDGEFMRQGIGLLGIPWLLYPQAKAGSIGARYASGGVVDSLGLSESESGDAEAVAKHDEVQRVWAEVHRRWPSYVNSPASEVRGIKTSWSRMMDKFIPDWREYSALHGAEKDWKSM